MVPILAVLYGVYVLLVGVRGNAQQLACNLSQEGQFIYWAIVLLVIAALWETTIGEQVAKPLAFLIVIGFLLKNWGKLVQNAHAVAPAVGSSASTGYSKA